MLFKHPTVLSDAKAFEKVQKCALKFKKMLRHVPHEAALQQSNGGSGEYYGPNASYEWKLANSAKLAPEKCFAHVNRNK